MTARSLAECIQEHAVRDPSAPALAWRERYISYGELTAMARTEAAAYADSAVFVRAEKAPRTIARILGCLLRRRAALLAPDDQSAPALGDLVTELAAPETAGIAFMLTTSGSTGKPKVVPLPAAAVDRFTDWAIATFQIGPQTSVLNYAPLNFDLCLLDVWATLKAGGCVVLVDPQHATQPEYVARLINTHRVDVVQSVPMLYTLLNDAGCHGNSSVRHVMFTGDVMPGRVLTALPRMFDNARFYNIYGCTETNDSFMYELDGTESGPVPIGSPLPGVLALIADDHGDLTSGASHGELWVSTPFQANGYLRGGERDDRFVRHDGRIFFRSGDRVTRRADGIFALDGRIDFQVKVRGVRVNPQEIEAVMAAHPAVAEVAVVAVPDDLAGHRLLATVRRYSGAELTGLSLREHCAMRLSRPAIPSVVVVADEPLPRTATGKIDRQLLISRGRSES
ncbi:AMP-binding protein [Allorhizocola rhizosphaerae]|uniref:AMP-binding protein n=1 Tax=Allorhizocola rhizosphaerae TaxID=1872709 RepID=UPI001B8C6443|nr:AMP-binding protein [Allorhizocola rhizosphaerae]